MGKINQDTISIKMQLFLTSLGESLPDWAFEKKTNSEEQEIGGLCEAFSFMLMRAAFINEEQQFFQRLLILSDADNEKITSLARLLINYRKCYKQIVVQYCKQLSEKIINSDKTKKNLEKIRTEHHAFIKKQVIAYLKLSEKEIESLEYADQLYTFISSLLFSHDPGVHYLFKNKKNVLNQGCYRELYTLLAPDKDLYRRKRKNFFYIKKVFSFAFIYQEAELVYMMKKILHKGDYVRFCSTDHTMYLRVDRGSQKEKRYTLYDVNNVSIPKKNASLSEVIEQSKKGFFEDLLLQSTYLPIEIAVYSRQSKKSSKRKTPDPGKLIQDIFQRRMMADVKNIQVDAKSWDDTTALISASVIGDYKSIRELLKNNADIEARNKEKSSPLSVAVGGGFVGCVKLLLMYNAKIELEHFNCAAEHDYIDIIKLLILTIKERKLDIDLIEKEAKIFFAKMVTLKKYSIMDLLLDEKAINIDQSEGEYGDTLLMQAIRKGDICFVKWLLKKGAQVNIKNKIEDSPLFLAIFYNQVEMVSELIKHGACVGQGKSDTPALISAGFYKNEAIIKLLKESNQLNQTPNLKPLSGFR